MILQRVWLSLLKFSTIPDTYCKYFQQNAFKIFFFLPISRVQHEVLIFFLYISNDYIISLILSFILIFVSSNFHWFCLWKVRKTENTVGSSFFLGRRKKIKGGPNFNINQQLLVYLSAGSLHVCVLNIATYILWHTHIHPSSSINKKKKCIVIWFSKYY